MSRQLLASSNNTRIRRAQQSRSSDLRSPIGSNGGLPSVPVDVHPETKIPRFTLSETGVTLNFSRIEDQLYTYLSKQYGKAAEFMKTLRHYNAFNRYQVIDLDESGSSDEDADEDENDERKPSAVESPPKVTEAQRESMKRLQQEIMVKSQQREMDEHRRNYPKMWAILWDHCSHASKVKIKEMENFEEAEVEADPLVLWKRIKAVHLVGEHPVPVISSVLALTRLFQLSQGRNQPLDEYYKCFEDHVKAAKALKCNPLTSQQLAALFFIQLDKSRYGGMRTNMENNITRKIEEFPENVADLYQYCKKHKVISQLQTNAPSPLVTSPSSAFITVGSKRSSRGSPKSNGSGRPRGRPPKQCFNCDSPDHLARDCPKQSSRSSSSNQPTSQSTSPVNPRNLQNPTDGYQTPAASRSSVDRGPARRGNAFVTIASVFSMSGVGQSRLYDTILFDNQATASIFSNRNYLHNVAIQQEPKVFEGLSEGNTIQAAAKGEFHGIVSPWLIEDGSTMVNIISMSEAVDNGCKVELIDNQFIVTSPSGYVMTFSHNDGLYTCDVPLAVDRVLITLAERESLYSQRDLEGAKKAHELVRVLGLANPKVAISVLTSALNCPVSIKNIKDAFDIYGPDLSTIRGATTKKKSIPVDTSLTSDLTPLNDQSIMNLYGDQTLHIDIMFVNSIAFLLCVATPLGLRMVTELGKGRGARSTPVLRKALFGVIDEFPTRGYKITTILTDGESGIAVLSPELQTIGIILNITGAGQHVPLAERAVRELKEHTRGLINTIPYKLSDRLLSYLIMFVVSRINMVPHRGSVATVSPREAFTGRKLDVEKHLRVRFGDYCEVTNPYSDNSMVSRTDPAIALGGSGNIQGTVRFLSLSTGQVVSRDQFKVLPTPEWVISTLNAMADDEANGGNGALNVMLGDRVIDADDAVDLNVHTEIVSADTVPPPSVSRGEQPDQIEPSERPYERWVVEGSTGRSRYLYHDGSSAEGPIVRNSAMNPDAPEFRPNAPEPFETRVTHEDDPIAGIECRVNAICLDDAFLQAPIPPYRRVVEIGPAETQNDPDFSDDYDDDVPELVERPGMINHDPVHLPEPFIDGPITQDGEISLSGVVGVEPTINPTDVGHPPGSPTGVADVSLLSIKDEATTHVPPVVPPPGPPGPPTQSNRVNTRSQTRRRVSVNRIVNQSRIRGPIFPPSSDRLFVSRSAASVYVARNMSPRAALVHHPVEGRNAIRMEIKSMVDHGVFKPIHMNDCGYTKPIHSHMFVSEKYRPDGSFDKLKARLVSGGNMQDRTNPVYAYENITSPTVSISHLLALFTLAANRSKQQYIRTADVPSAFLKADIGNFRVVIILDPVVTRIYVEMYPEFQEFVRPNGTMLVELLKAMYGCIESPRLWYDHITGVLTSGGFTPNPVDPCVFNGVFDGNQVTVALYVDDLVMMCERMNGIDYVTNLLEKSYGKLSITDGDVHSYLGMSLDFTQAGRVSITMKGYINKVLDEYRIDGHATSPCDDKVFDVDEQSPVISAKDKKIYHGAVAKLLYLAKRARPDLLLTVSFLASRTIEPRVQDQVKLTRILKYLNATRSMGMVLTLNGNPEIKCSIDASHATHPDMKSHGGMYLTIGSGPILVKSSKIKINTKSSTESELMAVSEHIGEAIDMHQFLMYQGCDTGPVTLYQDNQSTIAMLKNGRGSSSRTRHIDIRYFWICDLIKSGKVVVEYQPTESMLADMYTKPLVGGRFITACNKTQEWIV